jgi:hypothetical protein
MSVEFTISSEASALASQAFLHRGYKRIFAKKIGSVSWRASVLSRFALHYDWINFLVSKNQNVPLILLNDNPSRDL